MAHITLCLEDATQALVDQAAPANGMPTSRWVAEIVRQHAAQAWPQDCLPLAGRFTDFPLREESPTRPRDDAPRLGFKT